MRVPVRFPDVNVPVFGRYQFNPAFSDGFAGAGANILDFDPNSDNPLIKFCITSNWGYTAGLFYSLLKYQYQPNLGTTPIAARMVTAVYFTPRADGYEYSFGGDYTSPADTADYVLQTGIEGLQMMASTNGPRIKTISIDTYSTTVFGASQLSQYDFPANGLNINSAGDSGTVMKGRITGNFNNIASNHNTGFCVNNNKSALYPVIVYDLASHYYIVSDYVEASYVVLTTAGNLYTNAPVVTAKGSGARIMVQEGGVYYVYDVDGDGDIYYSFEVQQPSDIGASGVLYKCNNGQNYMAYNGQDSFVFNDDLSVYARLNFIAQDDVALYILGNYSTVPQKQSIDRNGLPFVVAQGGSGPLGTALYVLAPFSAEASFSLPVITPFPPPIALPCWEYCSTPSF